MVGNQIYEPHWIQHQATAITFAATTTTYEAEDVTEVGVLNNANPQLATNYVTHARLVNKDAANWLHVTTGRTPTAAGTPSAVAATAGSAVAVPPGGTLIVKLPDGPGQGCIKTIAVGGTVEGALSWGCKGRG